MKVKFNTVQDALRLLDETEWVIISIASDVVYEGPIGNVPYSVARRPLYGLNRSLSQSFYPVNMKTIGIAAQ